VLSVAPLASVTITGFVVFVLGILAAGPTLAKMLAAQQQERMSLTTDMVERMIGHRTRLVQQTLRSWHDGEDESVVTYGQNSRSVDRWTATLRALPRLYYVLSIVSLFFVIVSSPTQVALALSIGGMTLGMASLSALVDLVLNVGGLYALWSAIQPVVKDAAAQPTLHGARLEGAESGSASGSGTNVVELRGVRFGYPSRSRPVLDDVTLRIAAGERVLIEGPSGGGKTTLAALVTGMRLPDSGLVLVRGLDQHSIREDELRRVIASAPQFYKNHVFAGSLAFNLLLGRSWPPTAEDLREALGVARALGLGPMLSRMPAGIYQQVGATGWQLSHGEKSRVYLARTLLQRSELLVLDETFGALDPDTLKQCMDVVLERARTLVVITHR
jgi:ATP-binding cassette subfamily B protein